LTADGHTLDGKPVPSLTQKMVSDAFALVQGGETDVIDLGKGEYYAIRADKVSPAALPSLDEIRPQLTQLFLQQQLSQRLSAKADGFIQRIKKGESLDAVAASAGAKAQRVEDISRSKVQQTPELQAMGREFMGRLFLAKAGDVYAAGGVNYSLAVVKVAQIQPGSIQDVARETVALQPQVAQQLVQGDLTELVFAAANAEVKPKVDEGRARQAIGLQPLPASAAPGPAKAPSKAP
jgi:peptidyl-prolyl cis-trans isomerase D